MLAIPTVLLRLGLATLFGALLGIEREWRSKNAGIKTNGLVALGSAGFALMSDTFGPGNHNPAQIAAAVVGGIGFIGAGVILHRGATVQGLTTAATMWANASMGVAAGLGHVGIAAVMAAGVLIVQFIGRNIETTMRRVRRRAAPGRFELRVDGDRDAFHHVREVLTGEQLAITRRSMTRHDGNLSVRVAFRTDAPNPDFTGMEERLVALDGIRLVELRHLGVEED